METKKNYVVLNKEGLSGKALKEQTQVMINGDGRKAGDVVSLHPDAHNTKYLIGQGWVEPKDQPKPKVELDADEESGKGKKKK